jgi:hypothetical protein
MEMYEFQVMVDFRGTVEGYSKLDAWNRLRNQACNAIDDFEGSHIGRLARPTSYFLKVDSIPPQSRSDPQEPSIVLPNVMDWLP